MRISWKFPSLAGLAAAALLPAGCGGISASRTISPLDFILPGIIQAVPAPATPVPPATHGVTV